MMRRPVLMMQLRIKDVDVTTYGTVGFTIIIVIDRREMMLMMKCRG